MKLHIIMLSTDRSAAPELRSYIDCERPHRMTGAQRISRETGNCWYIDTPPKGLPERYRKAEEYTLISNQSGVYMFGSDPGQLVAAWNLALCA